MAVNKKINMNVSECASIIRHIAENCYGVVGLATPNGVTLRSQLFPNFFNKKSVEILASPNGYKINVYIIAGYGNSLKAICKNLCNSIKYILKQDYGIDTEVINIHIKGIQKSR